MRIAVCDDDIYMLRLLGDYLYRLRDPGSNLVWSSSKAVRILSALWNAEATI